MNVRVRSTNRIRGLWGGPIVLVIGLGILFLGVTTYPASKETG